MFTVCLVYILPLGVTPSKTVDNGGDRNSWGFAHKYGSSLISLILQGISLQSKYASNQRYVDAIFIGGTSPATNTFSMDPNTEQTITVFPFETDLNFNCLILFDLVNTQKL